jgi:hypothetical protein
MRTLIRLGVATLVSSWLMVAAGCNSSAFPPDTVGRYCEEVGGAACDRARACNAPMSGQCEQQLLAACCQKANCDASVPGVAQQAIDNCLSSLQNLSCGDLLAGRLPDACKGPQATSTNSSGY